MFTHTRNRKVLISISFILLLAGILPWLFRAQPKTPEGWKTTTSDGITFSYPEKLSTTYITAMDWPPQADRMGGPFECTEAGEETARAGKTERRMVDDRIYCRTTVTEGAAGSIYSQYAYASLVGDHMVILTFSTRAVQCGNYDEPQRDQCEGERESFDIDGVVDRIFRTIAQ